MQSFSWHVSTNDDNSNIVVRNERREIVADFETDDLVNRREARERAALVALAPQMLSLLRQLYTEKSDSRIVELLHKLDETKPKKYAIWWTNGDNSEILELKEFLSLEDAKDYASLLCETRDSDSFERSEIWAEVAE